MFTQQNRTLRQKWIIHCAISNSIFLLLTVLLRHAAMGNTLSSRSGITVVLVPLSQSRGESDAAVQNGEEFTNFCTPIEEAIASAENAEAVRQFLEWLQTYTDTPHGPVETVADDLKFHFTCVGCQENNIQRIEWYAACAAYLQRNPNNWTSDTVAFLTGVLEHAIQLASQ
jgi:hypothetical protein